MILQIIIVQLHLLYIKVLARLLIWKTILSVQCLLRRIIQMNPSKNLHTVLILRCSKKTSVEAPEPHLRRNFERLYCENSIPDLSLIILTRTKINSCILFFSQLVGLFRFSLIQNIYKMFKFIGRKCLLKTTVLIS